MNIKQLKEFCEATPLVVHNAKFEYGWLASRGISPKIVDDTMLLAYMYDERLPLDLESLCLKFNIDKSFKEHHGKEVAEIQGQQLIDRNVKDARNTKLLRDTLKPLLTKEEVYVYENVLLPAAKTLAQIEIQGICIDVNEVEKLQTDLDKLILDLDLKNDPVIRQFEESTELEFNIDSWMHRGVLIYDLLGYEPLPYKQAQTDEGTPSTQSKIMRKLLLSKNTDTLDKIIKYSSYNGWKESYANLISECDKCNHAHVQKIEDKHYVFTSLHLGGTSTGRIRSDHPNMQNIPSREGGWTRRVFVPRNPGGAILECDYDQIELRILAGLSQDERLLDEFLSGKDPHVEMAKIAFGKTDSTWTDEDRHWGKTLNYAIPFGRGAGGIAFDTGRTVKEAQIWLKRYWKEHKKLKEYLDTIPQSGVVVSPTGMKRHIESWTQGKNHPIQNSAFIVLMMALNRVVPEAARLGCPVDLCIHDSIRYDLDDKNKVDKVLPELKELVEFQAYEAYSWLPVPLSVSFKVGDNWGDMKKVKL